MSVRRRRVARQSGIHCLQINKRSIGCKKFLSKTLPVVLLAAGLGLVDSAVHSLHAAEPVWTTGTVRIAKESLTVTPATQMVPLNVGTTVNTHFSGGPDPIPSDWVVKADLVGPGYDSSNPQVLKTFPNQPFRIPPLSVKGDYTLENIKLVPGSGRAHLHRR